MQQEEIWTKSSMAGDVLSSKQPSGAAYLGVPCIPSAGR